MKEDSTVGGIGSIAGIKILVSDYMEDNAILVGRKMFEQIKKASHD